MKKLLILSALVVACATYLVSQPAQASNDKKVTICHAAGQAGTTHYETLSINFHALSAHFEHNGTPKAGHEDDYMGPCVVASTPTPTPVSTPTPTPVATATPAPLTCNWNHLKVLPYPNPANWNFTGQFQVTNTASYAMTFDWLLDMWGHSNQNQSGTQTLQPGESKVYGFGNICPKWQFDVWCNGQIWGAIVESHANACYSPTPTPVSTPTPTPTTTPTPSATPAPSSTPVVTPSPTPVPSVGKQSKLAVTNPVCDAENMDAIAELFNDGKGVANVNVKFVYNNEAKYAKTDENGKASVTYGYRGDSAVEMDPEEDGYASQSHKVTANLDVDCAYGIGGGDILGATSDGQILGMAEAGIAQDVIMGFVGLMGTISTALGFKSLKKKN